MGRWSGESWEGWGGGHGAQILDDDSGTRRGVV